MNYPYLSNAPIREALIELKFNKINEDFISKLGDLDKELLKDFDRDENQITITGTLGQPKASQETEIIGKRYFNDKNHTVLQLGDSSFITNKTKPYNDFNDLVTFSGKYWDIYSRKAGINSINRIGLRYINSITAEIQGELNTIFKKPPTLTTDIDIAVNGLFSRHTFKTSDGYDCAIIITLSPNKENKGTEFLVDIDVSRSEVTKIDNWSDLKIRLSRMREIKNQIFFNCLTEEKIEEYK
jgi:uncharacterized protein (TIGR04255 family)